MHCMYSGMAKGSVTLKLHTKFEIFETFFKISRLKPNISNLNDFKHTKLTTMCDNTV